MGTVTGPVSRAAAWMRRFRAAEGVGAGGLAAPGARWALVFVWAMGSVRRVLDGQPIIPSLWFPIAYTMLLIAVLLLTRRENLPLRCANAILVPSLALGGLVIVQAAQPETPPDWMVYVTAYLMALLFVRGNPVASGVGVLVHLVIVGTWAGTGAVPADMLAHVLLASLIAGTVAVVWRVTLSTIVAREHEHRSDAAKHERQIQAEHEAAERSARELELVRSKASDVLARLSAGEPLDDAFRTEIAMVEGGIRDRIRSPRMQHPVLTREIDAARAQGTSVTMLADDSPDAPNLGEATAREIAAILRSLNGADSLVVAWTEPEHVSIVAREGERIERHVIQVGAQAVGHASLE